MNFEFHPEALDEFKEAAKYYGNRRRGLELRFIEAVETALELVCQNPQRGRIYEGDVRCILTRVFPYAVLYSIEPEYLLVITVMHGHREPGYWRERVKSKT